MRHSRKPTPDHPLTRKHRSGRRRKGILWDYNGDGRWPEHLNADDKAYWRRYDRRQMKRTEDD